MNQIPEHIKKTKRFRFFIKPICVCAVIFLIITYKIFGEKILVKKTI
jgi:hypothetical protein